MRIVTTVATTAPRAYARGHEALGWRLQLTRLAIPIASAAVALGCTAISGLDDLDVAEDRGRRVRVDAHRIDGGEIDSDGISSERRYSGAPEAGDPEASVVGDAATDDASDAGYTNLSARWAGTWKEDFTIIGGAATIRFIQADDVLIGAVELQGGACPGTGTWFAGFVAADEIAGRFTSDDGRLVLNLRSTISADAKTMIGRFTSVGNCLPDAVGSIELTRP